MKSDNIERYNSRVDIGGEEIYALVLFKFEFDYDIYRRRVYTVGELLSDLGGIQQSLFTIGAILVGIFSEKMFYSQIISDIY